MGLKEARFEIDDLDAQIVGLLKERFKKSVEIGREKRWLGMGVEDNEREEVVRNNFKNARGELDEGFLEEFVELLLKYSKEAQAK
jgi:chorismate mutase